MSRPFPTVRGEPRRAYDAVVIGAGVGGLTCATLLARAGQRVLLVEQHYMVGGYCSTFRRSGYTFDAATHFYPLLGNPGTITGRLLQDLEIDTGWIKMDPVDRFHCPDGSTFDAPADFEAYRRQLAVAFPLEAPAIDRFFALVRRAYVGGMQHYFRGRGIGALCGLQQRTIRDVIDEHFHDRKLKLLLMGDCAHWGSPPSRTSFVFDSMLRLGYFLGNYYPRGGSQAFVDALARRFTDYGGEILMPSRVTRIAVDRGAARAVEVESGPPRARRRRRIEAEAVVSNADLRQTCEQLIGVEHFAGEDAAALRRLRPSMPCFLMYIGLRGVTTAEVEAIHGYHWRSWDTDRVVPDGLAFKLFVPTLYDPAMAPAGGHVIIVQKLVDVDYAAVVDWASHKAAIERDVLSNLERVFPGVTSRMVVRLSATAQTSWRYTLNHAGAMLGWEMSPEQLGAHRPGTASPIENLHYVGHWTRPGGGITPVILSAMEVAAELTASGGDRPPTGALARTPAASPSMYAESAS